MVWLLIFVLVLLIPILSIVLDSRLGHALAARLERRGVGRSDDLLADRLAYLEGEVERLTSQLKRLDEEGQFLHRLLLEGRDEGPALPKGERSD